MASKVAYGVYYYPSSASTAGASIGEVGRADYDGSSAITHFVSGASPDGNIAALTSDPKVFWFKNLGGEERLLVAETSYAPTTFIPYPSLFSVYDAGTLSKVWPLNANAPAEDPVVNGKTQWSDLINVYAIDTADADGVHYLYGIDYDRHKVFRVKNTATGGGANNDNYDFDYGAGYIYSDGVPYKYGVDLYIDSDSSFIFALFIRSEDQYGGPYDSSAVVKLPLDLDPFAGGAAKTVAVEKNAVTLNAYGDYLYVPSIGGPQNYGSSNADSKLQRVAKADLTVTTLLVNAASGTDAGYDTTDFRDVAVSPDGSQVFILKGRYDSTDSTKFSGWLFGTDIDTLDAASAALISTLGLPYVQFVSIFGFTWALYYDAADGAVWVARGNDLAIYTGGRQISPVASLGMGDGKAFLAGEGFDLNAVTLYDPNAVLRGAKDPAAASNTAKANAAKAAAAGEGEEEK
jgi:hypothetical protein